MCEIRTDVLAEKPKLDREYLWSSHGRSLQRIMNTEEMSYCIVSELAKEMPHVSKHVHTAKPVHYGLCTIRYLYQPVT